MICIHIFFVTSNQCNRVGASRMLNRMANSGIYSPEPGEMGDIDEPKNKNVDFGGGTVGTVSLSDEGTDEEQQFSFDM